MGLSVSCRPFRARLVGGSTQGSACRLDPGLRLLSPLRGCGGWGFSGYTVIRSTLEGGFSEEMSPRPAPRQAWRLTPRRGRWKQGGSTSENRMAVPLCTRTHFCHGLPALQGPGAAIEVNVNAGVLKPGSVSGWIIVLTNDKEFRGIRIPVTARVRG